MAIGFCGIAHGINKNRKKKRVISFVKYVRFSRSCRLYVITFLNAGSDQGHSSTKVERACKSKVIFYKKTSTCRGMTVRSPSGCRYGASHPAKAHDLPLHSSNYVATGGQLTGKNVLLSQPLPPFVEV